MKNTIAKWLITALIITLLGGCSGGQTGNGGQAETGGTQGQETATGQSEETGSAEDLPEEALETQGTELHIYCTSDTFRNRMQGYFPEYKRLNSRLGMIRDIKVVWHVISEEDGVYKDVLLQKLEEQKDEPGQEAESGQEAGQEQAAASESPERIDMMVLSEGDLSVLLESGYLMALEDDLGLTQKELADQFAYTRKMASDQAGVQRAATWQALPGVFVYRRSIAEDVLGTQDPAEVQELIGDWDLFAERAPEMTARKYYMLSGYMDAYKAFADASDTPWVQDGEITVSESLEEWMTLANDFTNHKQHGGTDLRSEDWYRDQTGEGRVFGFFTQTSSIRYSVQGSEDEENSAYGDYAVCMGPQTYHWESLYLAGAKGTDNEELVAEIIRTMTCVPDIMKQITFELQEFTNTVSGMEELAGVEFNEMFSQELLGGQNPMPVYLAAAKNMHVRPVTVYDKDLDAGFQVCAKNFFTGKMKRDAAVTNFFKVAVQRHPELTYEGMEE